jgi:hypothetical protein
VKIILIQVKNKSKYLPRENKLCQGHVQRVATPIITSKVTNLVSSASPLRSVINLFVILLLAFPPEVLNKGHMLPTLKTL